MKQYCIKNKQFLCWAAEKLTLDSVEWTMAICSDLYQLFWLLIILLFSLIILSKLNIPYPDSTIIYMWCFIRMQYRSNSVIKILWTLICYLFFFLLLYFFSIIAEKFPPSYIYCTITACECMCVPIKCSMLCNSPPNEPIRDYWISAWFT